MKKIIEYVTTHVHHIALILLSGFGVVSLATLSQLCYCIFGVILVLYMIYFIATFDI